MTRYRRYFENDVVSDSAIYHLSSFPLSKRKQNAPEEYITELYQFYHHEHLVQELSVKLTSLEQSTYQ